MTENKRIVLNTLVSYGRTMLAMCLGLFSSRWVFNALGKEAYGLFAVVGSLTYTVSFLNNLLSASVARFYAYAIGEARRQSDDAALENLQRWFNAAVSIHVLLPLVLVVAGYPVGAYAIKHWLVIPSGLETSCLWVFRVSLVAAFIAMSSAPYVSVYTARQLIAELSLWSVITTIVNFVLAYWIRTYDGNRFLVYAILSGLAPATILCIQVVRARRHFQMCRIKRKYLFDFGRLRQIFAYAFGEFFGWFGSLVCSTGSMFLVNRSFGPAVNASYGIADRVTSYTSSLSGALQGAISPAIVSAKGGGNSSRAMNLTLKSCKFTALLVLLFCMPLSIEVDEVLKLWLVNPPEHVGTLCRCALASLVVYKLGIGAHMLVQATGRIIRMQVASCALSFLALGLIVVLIFSGAGAASAAYAAVALSCANTLVRVYFAKRFAGLPVREWLRHCVIPVTAVAAATLAVGATFASFFPQHFLRVVATSAVCAASCLAVSLLFAFDCAERQRLSVGILSLRDRFMRG